MWIQLPAAFVCSDKSSYVQGLSLSDFNQFSGEVCAGDTDQDLPYVSERFVCVCVCVLDACAQTCLWECQNWVIETVKERENTKAFYNRIHLKRNPIPHQSP